jgi:hypothetical protein
MSSEPEGREPTRGEEDRRTLSEKECYILKKFPMEPHWKTPHPPGPFGWVPEAVFNALCLACYGHPGLLPVWASIKLDQDGDESVWVEGIRQMCERLNNMLVVVRLHPTLHTRVNVG